MPCSFRSAITLFLAALLVAAGSLFVSAPRSSAHHDAPIDGDDVVARAIQLVVDAEPTLARVYEPNVPEDCWTIQEFPYTRDAFFERREECVDPWVSTHQMFTFEVEAGGTYVVWNELLAPGMQAQFIPPTKEVFVESAGENRWLGFQSPLVDVENQTIGHLPSNRWVEDISVLERWGWDSETYIDYRTPTEEGVRNRLAYVFTAKEDGNWRISAEGTNPLPPGSYDQEGDNIRVWVQRLDGVSAESTVFVFERFEYPPVNELLIEHGATVFRDFELIDRDTNEPSTNVSVTLSPTGTCSSLDPGHMRCTIETSQVPQGPLQFRFTSATHNGDPESTADWPSFGFTTVPRDIKTRAEMTLDAKAKGQIVGGIFVTGESGLGIDFHENGSLTLDGGEAVALGVASDVGFGGGLKLGWITPRAKGEIEFEGDVKAFESVAIDIADPGDFDQQVAMSAFVFDRLVSLGTIATSTPVDVIADTFREDVLQQQFKPYIAADEVGVAASANLTGKLGSWTGNRPGLGALNMGMGGTAGGSISASWKLDSKTGDHAIVVQVSASGSALFDPTLWPLYFEGQEVNYSILAGANVEVTFAFDGNPIESGRLKSVTVEVKGGTTWEERIDSGSVSITFDGDQLSRTSDFLIRSLSDLSNPASSTEFSAELLSEMFAVAFEDVDGELVVKRSRGTRFRPTFELGAELLAGVGVSGEVEVGGDWRLVVTQKTQDWRLLEDSDGKRGLVQIAEFPFENTIASENQASDIATPFIAQALGTVLVSPEFGSWVREEWEAGQDLTIDASSEQTETALLDFSGDDTTVTDRLTGEVAALEIAVRTWFNVLLPEWVVPGGHLNTPATGQNLPVSLSSNDSQQSLPPSFFASEFMEIAPAGITVDPPVQIKLSYLSDPVDPQQLRMYRYAGNGKWEPLPTEIDGDARVATAQISEFGTFVVGLDTTPPEIIPVQTTTGFSAVVGDLGSGIDSDSISLTVDGNSVQTAYDAATSTISTLEPIEDGAEIVLIVSDAAGNEASYEGVITSLPDDEDSGSGSSSNGNASAQPTSTPPSSPGGDGESPDEEGSGGGVSPVVIILIVLLLLALAGGGALYFMRKQSSASPA